MIRVLALAACGLCTASLGCDGRAETGQASGRSIPTPLELTIAWAGPKVRVTRFAPVVVPGYELFLLASTDEQGPPTRFGVAVPIDEQNFLEGMGAVRALIRAGTSDATEVARLSMLFLERGGEPLMGPRSEIHREFGVTPPIIVDGVLTYWYQRGSWSFVELLRSRLTLETLELSTESIHLTEHHRTRQ